jgi:hypothetical protein
LSLRRWGRVRGSEPITPGFGLSVIGSDDRAPTSAVPQARCPLPRSDCP